MGLIVAVIRRKLVLVQQYAHYHLIEGSKSWDYRRKPQISGYLVVVPNFGPKLNTFDQMGPNC